MCLAPVKLYTTAGPSSSKQMKANVKALKHCQNVMRGIKKHQKKLQKKTQKKKQEEEEDDTHADTEEERERHSARYADSEYEEESHSDGLVDSEDEEEMFELQRQMNWLRRPGRQTNRRRQRAMRLGRSRPNRILRRALLERIRERRRVRGLYRRLNQLLPPGHEDIPEDADEDHPQGYLNREHPLYYERFPNTDYDGSKLRGDLD